MLFCQLLSTGSLLVTVHVPCKATQEWQSWVGRPAGRAECLGGGPFIPLTRSLPLAKYKLSPVTLRGVTGACVGHRYCPEPLLHCLLAPDAKPVIKDC